MFVSVTSQRQKTGVSTWIYVGVIFSRAITGTRRNRSTKFCPPPEDDSARLSEGVGAMSGGRFGDCPAGARSSGRPDTSHNLASLPGVVSQGYGRDDGSDEVKNEGFEIGSEAHGFQSDSDGAAILASSCRLRSAVFPAVRRESSRRSGQRPRTEAGPLDSVRRPSGRRPCDPVDDDVMTSARDWSRTARGRPNYRACGDRRSGESSGSDTPDRHGNERRSRNVNKNKTFGRNSDRRYGKNYELISDDDTSSSDSDASPVGHSRIDNKRDSRRYEKSYGLGRRNGREGHRSVSADRHDSHRRKGKTDERDVGVKFSHRSRRVKEQTKIRNKTGRACIDCDSDKSGSEAEYQSVHRKSGTRAVKSTHRKHKHKRDKGSRVHSDSEGELPRRKKSPDDVHLSRSRAPENTHRHACKRSVSRDAKRDSESSADSRRVLPTLKLGSYDGTSCLETFLAKFRNISEYYSWSERDQLCHLRASLEGRAGQVLWDAGKHGTVTELIELLKNLFGTQDQTKMLRQVTQSKN